MTQIYLVCTRSAISASALTYIINQSPQFYNVVHNNLWLREKGTQFENAVIIEDWWNIPNTFANTYNHDVRNNENIKLETLQNLCNKWENLNTDKHIALFTHATNTADIMQWRDEYNLPITVVTTIMGNNCYLYMDLFLKREFNFDMNEYVNLLNTWKYIYNQFLSQDMFWSKHADIVFEMNDWLNDPSVVYSGLGISHNHNMKFWLDQYKQLNGYHEWDIQLNNIENKCKTMCYIYGKYESLFNTNPAKKLFAIAILKSVQFHDTDLEQIVDNIQKTVRKQLTFA
tara:strand:+ start:45 stop:902 length:858 start_codon:yes stop_codon:yes gene_type:complete